MIQDPLNSYIAAIMSRYDLNGKDVLEIGCGTGRITRDLAKHARCVVAADPDRVALDAARAAIEAPNVEFRETPSGMPDCTEGSFDVVIYTLSFHHVPVAEMADSLNKAATVLKKDGVIIILEPGDKGSFTLAKEQYGAGSGDEGPVKAAAVKAMHSLAGWDVGETHHFYTQFQFDSYEDFFANMLPDFRQKPDDFISEVKKFLCLHRTVNGFILDAERRLNVLMRKDDNQ